MSYNQEGQGLGLGAGVRCSGVVLRCRFNPRDAHPAAGCASRGSVPASSGFAISAPHSAYSATTPDDLAQALQDAADAAATGSFPLQGQVRVKELMDSWARQPGYPVLTIIRHYDSNTAAVSQVRPALLDTSAQHRPLCLKTAVTLVSVP